MKSTYVCPYCNEKADAAISWQKALVAYSYNLKLKTWELKDVIGGDTENWACPNCGKTLPARITLKFPI